VGGASGVIRSCRGFLASPAIALACCAIVWFVQCIRCGVTTMDGSERANHCVYACRRVTERRRGRSLSFRRVLASSCVSSCARVVASHRRAGACRLCCGPSSRSAWPCGLSGVSTRAEARGPASRRRVRRARARRLVVRAQRAQAAGRSCSRHGSVGARVPIMSSRRFAVLAVRPELRAHVVASSCRSIVRTRRLAVLPSSESAAGLVRVVMPLVSSRRRAVEPSRRVLRAARAHGGGRGGRASSHGACAREPRGACRP
jgi:hypothetical protein